MKRKRRMSWRKRRVEDVMQKQRITRRNGIHLGIRRTEK